MVPGASNQGPSHKSYALDPEAVMAAQCKVV